MFRPYIALTVLLLFSTIALQPHAVGTGLNGFLSQYINQSTINSATFHNESVGSNNYVIMELPNGQIVVINQTNGYRLVLNNTAAYAALRPWAIATFTPTNATLSQLYNYMYAYEVTAAKNLSSCLQLTGLNQPGATCTAFNGCFSCATVPICKKAMNAYGGPSSAFAYQIGNLSVQYHNLNASYNEYYSVLTSFTPNNAYQSLLKLQQAAANVSSDAAILKTNGMFPPPPGFNPAIQQSCPSIPTSSSPWYCQIFDFCTYLNFNSSQIYNIQALLPSLLSEPLSNGSIEGVAANATGAALSFLAPQEKVQLNVIIGQQYGRFNATSANASLLSSEYYNLSLKSSLSAYQKTFADLLSYNLRLNATTYNSTLNAQYRNLTAIYNVLSVQYNVVHSLAANNTAALLLKELNYQIEPPALAALAFLQQSINTQLVAGINTSSSNGIYAKLEQVKSGIGSTITPITGPTMIKAIDGPIVAALLAGSSAPLSANLSTGALYILMVSLVVVVVIVILIYLLLFRRLRKKGRVHLHRRAKRAWMLLFIIIIVVGIALSYLEYMYAQQANSFLPISGFISQLSSHSSVVIAYNSSAAAAAPSILQCTTALKQTLQSSLGKQVSMVTLDNYSCVSSSNSIYSQPNCFDQLLANGTPVIVITESLNSSIIYRGIYGHVLYASGTAASGPACELNTVIKVQ